MRQKIGAALQGLAKAIGMAWQWLVCAIANSRRRLFRKRLPGYVVFTLTGSLAERDPQTPWWYGYLPGRRAPQSLESLRRAFERIAADPDVQGVILLLRETQFGLARAQNLAALFDQFRGWDEQIHGAQRLQHKQIVVHLETIGAASYVVAAAADVVALAPLATWEVVGLHAAPLFLRETLARLGVAFDVVQIAPWKTAMDTFSRADMSDEQRSQLTWLLESFYDDIVTAIADGRHLSPETVRALIDRAPLSAHEAQSAGLADHVCYEDELATRLGDGENEPELAPYAKIHKLLWRRPQRRHSRAIGVLTLTGAISTGESRRFPIPLPIFGEETIGSRAVQQQVRAARKQHDLAAVVVHVDSPGGSALASDLIWRELKLLNEEKPVIVYMGDVAASGGYYIATPSRKIVAQTATLTGSIGVITAKAVTEAALAKVDAHRETVSLGANADLYDSNQPWSDAQRSLVRKEVERIYSVFTERVVEGRAIERERLDALCNGRVWSGRQALENGLVDALGDFQVAVDLACEAAGLPIDGSVRTEAIAPPKAYSVATAAQPPESWLDPGGLHATMHLVGALAFGQWDELLGAERYWLIADGLPKI